MRRTTVRNRAFQRIGSLYGPLIDPNHFLGRSSFDIKRKAKKESNEPVDHSAKQIVLNPLKHTKDELGMRLENNRA